MHPLNLLQVMCNLNYKKNIYFSDIHDNNKLENRN
jgi:hypothetical protein